jgi:hypothetical protein
VPFTGDTCHAPRQLFAAQHVTSAQALATAKAQEPFQFVGVITIVSGYGDDFSNNSCHSDGRTVWAVIVYGNFHAASCGPPPIAPQSPSCPPMQHTGVFLVDYATGKELSFQIPAPSRYQPPAGFSPAPSSTP